MKPAYTLSTRFPEVLVVAQYRTLCPLLQRNAWRANRPDIHPEAQCFVVSSLDSPHRAAHMHIPAFHKDLCNS